MCYDYPMKFKCEKCGVEFELMASQCGFPNIAICEDCYYKSQTIYLPPAKIRWWEKFLLIFKRRVKIIDGHGIYHFKKLGGTLHLIKEERFKK